MGPHRPAGGADLQRVDAGAAATNAPGEYRVDDGVELLAVPRRDVLPRREAERRETERRDGLPEVASAPGERGRGFAMRRWVYPRGPLQLCGFATRVRWVHGAGWPSGFAAKPAPLAS